MKLRYLLFIVPIFLILISCNIDDAKSSTDKSTTIVTSSEVKPSNSTTTTETSESSSTPTTTSTSSTKKPAIDVGGEVDDGGETWGSIR
ncbi:MAG: hypothetical protein IKP77_03250 [Acholeplasmatales bacterium]|nr:hypothetical protein [Acholeplasmatales bacterium]